MTSPKSRYAETRPLTGARGEAAVFAGLRPRTIPPATGVLEYTVKAGDRLDLLALHFYNDTRRWWRILDANPQIHFGADLMLEDAVGETILIPRAAEAGGGS